jgi:hypothetical protein
MTPNETMPCTITLGDAFQWQGKIYDYKFKFAQGGKIVVEVFTQPKVVKAREVAKLREQLEKLPDKTPLCAPSFYSHPQGHYGP